MEKSPAVEQTVDISTLPQQGLVEQRTTDLSVVSPPSQVVANEEGALSQLAGTLVNRFFFVSTLKWKSTSTQGQKLAFIDLPNDVMKAGDHVPIIVQPLSNFSLIRPDFTIRVEVSSHRFLSGQLLIAAIYAPKADQHLVDRENIYALTQAPHVVLTLETGSPVELSVPYASPLSYWGNSEKQPDEPILRIYFFVLSGINGLEVPPTIDVVVFARIDQLQVAGLRHRSVVASYESLTGNLMSIAENALRQFNPDNNRDNPPDTQSPVMVTPSPGNSWCIGTGAARPLQSLRLDALAQSPHPDAVDEMKVEFVTRKFALLAAKQWRSTSIAGNLIFSCDSGPLKDRTTYTECRAGNYNSNLLGSAYITPLGVISSLFAYYSGGIEMKIVINAPFSVSGKLIVGVVPGTVDVTKLVPSIDMVSSPNLIMDVQGHTEAVFTIPFFSTRPVSNVASSWVRNNEWKAAGTTVTDCVKHGAFFIAVLNPLSSNGISSVDVLIYERAGVDFELSVPTQPRIGLGFDRYFLTDKSTKVVTALPGYQPVGVGVWHTTSNGAILRYGEVSDHVAQFAGAEFGVVYVFGNMDGHGFHSATIPCTYGDVAGTAAFFCRVKVEGDDHVYLAAFRNATVARAYAADPVPGKMQAHKTATDMYVDASPDKGWCWVPVASYEADDRDLAPNVAPAGKGTGQSSMSIHGEKFDDLKTLCRRYVLIADETYELNDAKYGVSFYEYPVHPMGLPVLRGTPDVARDTAFNLVRNGPTAIVASGYAFFRGGIRNRIVMSTVSTDVAFSVSHSPDMLPASWSPQRGNDVSQRGVVSVGTAMTVLEPSVNSQVEFEIPNYVPGHFGYMGRRKWTKKHDVQSTCASLGRVLIAPKSGSISNTKLRFQIHQAIADDHRFYHFQGFPPMVWSAMVPIMNSVNMFPNGVPEAVVGGADVGSTFEIVDQQARYEMLSRAMLGVKKKDLKNVVSSVSASADAGAELVQKMLDNNIVEKMATSADAIQAVCTDAQQALSSTKQALGQVLDAGGVAEQIASCSKRVEDTFGEPTDCTLNDVITAATRELGVIGVARSKIGHFVEVLREMFVDGPVMFIKRIGSFVKDMIKFFAATDLRSVENYWSIVLRRMGGLGLLLAAGFGIWHGVLAKIHRYYKGSAPRREDLDLTKEEQGGLLGLLATSVLTAMDVNDARTKKSALKFAHGYAAKDFILTFSRTVGLGNGIATLYAKCHGVMVAVKNWVMRRVKPDLFKLEDMVSCKGEITQWALTCMKLCRPDMRSKINKHPELINYVYAMATLGEVLLSRSKDVSAPVMTNIRAVAERIMTLRDELINEKIEPGWKREPFVVYMYGAAGIGKSTLQQYVLSEMFAEIGQACGPTDVYVRTAGNEWWNGVSDQKVVVYDDFGFQMSPENKQFGELVQLKTNTAFNPPCAALEEKRRKYAPTVVYCNSNVLDLRVPTLNADALNRRRDALWEVRIKPELGVQLATELTEAQLEGFAHLDFRQVKPTELTPVTGEWISYRSFCTEVRGAFATFYERASKVYVKSMQDAMGVEFGASSSFADICRSAERVISEWDASTRRVMEEVPGMFAPEEGLFEPDDAESSDGGEELERAGVRREAAEDIASTSDSSLLPPPLYQSVVLYGHEHCAHHAAAAGAASLCKEGLTHVARGIEIDGRLFHMDMAPCEDARCVTKCGFCYTRITDSICKKQYGLPVEQVPLAALPTIVQNNVLYKTNPSKWCWKVIKDKIRALWDEVQSQGLWSSIMRWARELLPISLVISNLVVVSKLFRGSRKPEQQSFNVSMDSPSSDSGAESKRNRQRSTFFDGSRTLAAKVERQMAEEQYDPVHSLILSQIVIISSEGDSALSVHGMFTHGRCLLTVRHFFDRLSAKSSVSVKFANGAKYQCFVGDIERRDLVGNPLTCAILPRSLPSKRDIRKHIAAREDHAEVRLRGALYELNRGSNVVTRSLVEVGVKRDLVIDADEKYKPDIVDRCYQYNHHGFGLCGAPLVLPKLPPKIYAIHFAGDGSNGYGVPIARETFEFDAGPLPAVVQAQCCDLRKLPTGLLPVCEVPMAVRTSSKSRIVPSLGAHRFEPPLTRPSPLIADLEHPGDPLYEGVRKHARCVSAIDPKTVAVVVNDYEEKILSVVRPVAHLDSAEEGVMSIEQAFSGVPSLRHFHGLELRTSEGYPLVLGRPAGKTNKSWLFKYEDLAAGRRLLGLHPRLEELIDQHRVMREADVIPPSVFVDILKDARIPIEKYAKPGCTRVISICPVELTIATRQYFGLFLAAFHEAFYDAEIAIGINPDSQQWGDLKLHCVPSDRFERAVVGDYSGFGDTLHHELLIAAFDIINKWYDLYYPNSMAQRVRSVICEEIVHGLRLFKRQVYQSAAGMPSGNAMTVELNSMVNSMYLRAAYVVKVVEPGTLPLSRFGQFTRIVTYGDDVLMTVMNDVLPHYNGSVIAEWLDSVGIQFNSAYNKGPVEPSVSFAEAIFLKRTFVRHPTRPLAYLAPLPVDSIRECLKWVWKSDNPWGAFLNNARAALCAAYGRGPLFHSLLREELRAVVSECSPFVEGRHLRSETWGATDYAIAHKLRFQWIDLEDREESFD